MLVKGATDLYSYTPSDLLCKVYVLPRDSFHWYFARVAIAKEIGFAVIQYMAVRLQEIFAHAMAPQLSFVYAKFCSILCVRIEVKAKRKFYEIWISMEIPLMWRVTERDFTWLALCCCWLWLYTNQWYPYPAWLYWPWAIRLLPLW